MKFISSNHIYMVSCDIALQKKQYALAKRKFQLYKLLTERIFDSDEYEDHIYFDSPDKMPIPFNKKLDK